MEEAMIASVHYYELAASADESDFRAAAAAAVERDLFENVPGLVEYRIGRGIRGARAGRFAAVWIYESRDAWADVWGPVAEPVPKTEYPDEWLVWEDELLDPILDSDPDDIEHTAYEVIASDTDLSAVVERG